MLPRTHTLAIKRRTWLRAWVTGALTLGAASVAPPLSAASTLRVGSPAPPLALQTLEGQRIATTDLQGQVVLVTFWATWCAPCQEELPLLSDYAQTQAAHGLRVLAFSLDSPAQLPKVRQMASRWSFPVGLLDSPWVPGYGRIWKLPVSFVIDRQGRLQYNGWDDPEPTWTAAKLHQVVDPLLQDRSGALSSVSTPAPR